MVEAQHSFSELHPMVRSETYTSNVRWLPGQQPHQLLPVEAYTSADWFERERRELFGSTWTFAGMTSDVANSGDYLTVDPGDAALVVLRDKDGSLRAFHNVCRHRGTRLLEGSGNVGRTFITCFYHKWAYSLKGELQLSAVPHQQKLFPGLDKSKFSLKPAKLDVWMNMIFVHPDPTAEPFEEWLADVPEKLGPFEPGQTALHDPALLVETSDIVHRIRANWKIVTENFIDGYHLSLLHTVSLGDGDFARQRWEPAGRHQAFYRPTKPGVEQDRSFLSSASTPVVPGVPENYGASYQWMFPNVGVFQTATSWSTFHVIPVSATECWTRTRIWEVPTPSMPAMEEIRPEDLPSHIVSAKGINIAPESLAKEVHALESNDVTLEDIYACEMVQSGMMSSAFSVGPLSLWEAPITFFQRQVLQSMSSQQP